MANGKLCITAAMMTLLSSSFARGQSCKIFNDNDLLTLTGTVVQSATVQEYEGVKPHKYMAMVLDDPICFRAAQDQEIRLILGQPIPMRWLGHYVKAEGRLIAGDSWSIAITRISDVR